MSRALHAILLAAQNSAWANATLFGAMEALPTDAFTAPRPGFFPSLAETLNHNHVVDQFYVDALTASGRGRSIFEQADITDAAMLACAQAKVDAQLIAFCESLDDNMLDETRLIAREDGPVPEVVSEILAHLFQHQIHHRGQAHVQLLEAGIAPPQLDEFYLSHGRIPSVAAIRGPH